MRTFLGWVMAAALVAGAYAAVMFIPLYLDHWEVQDIGNKTFNQFRDLGVDGVRQAIRDALNRVTFMTHEEDDDFGGTKVVKGMGMTDEDVLVEYDEERKLLHVHFEYRRVVALKPTDKRRVVRFVYDKRGEPPNVF
ncbi:MAG: hypothetical protein INH41_02780 [Myxococcaceae bacterium]|jgi:hypothetical protein|nr:hypothetical protein [Myxococcaceae bacterium]